MVFLAPPTVAGREVEAGRRIEQVIYIYFIMMM